MIAILFTTSEKPMARLIRWATGECCSHVAILRTDEVGEDFVVHSNWKGVNVISVDKFFAENTIIHQVEIPSTPQNNVRLLELMYMKKGNYYDIGALLFCGVVLFLRKALGFRSWPKVNLWQSSGMDLCTEFVTEYLYGSADSLITPHQLYERIK